MTFKQIAIKNFLSHTRRYFSYLLCSSFTIMVFFIYTTLFFNNQLLTYAKDTGFDVLFYISLVAIVLFSIFFINYAHTTFVKARTNEFALLMTLGLVKKNIGRMIVIENSIILTCAMAIGLLFGALFSRIFFLIIRFLVENGDLHFMLDYRSFLTTGIVFLLIYMVAIGMSRKVITKLSIVQLLKKKREMITAKGKVWVGILGIVLFLSSLIFVGIITHMAGFSERGYLFMVYAVLAFVSMYLIISQFGCLLIQLIKRNKKSYYQNILSISEIEYTFTQNKKVLFVLSLLSAMIVFFVASPFSLLSISKQIAEAGRDSAVEYVVINDINQIEEPKLQEILSQAKTPLTSMGQTEFLLLPVQIGSETIQKPMINESLYQKLNQKSLNLKLGDVVQLITTWLPGYDEMKDVTEITVLDAENEMTFKWIGNATGKGISTDLQPSNITFVISDEAYANLKAKINRSSIGNIQQLHFEKWELTESFIIDLENNLQNRSISYPVAATLRSYQEVKRVYAMMIFFTSFMGVLFFVSAGSILYFKQYGDMERLKEKYFKLSRIGLTRKELVKIYTATLKINFFTPLIFGIIIGFAFIYMTTFLVGGGDMIGVFMKSSVIVAGCYCLFQLVYYSLALKQYKQSVFKKVIL